MCILQGFPTAPKSKTSFPFGLWFADPDTLYVADEGNADTTYSTADGSFTAAAAQAGAGLQKWVRTAGTWHLAYTLQAGLDLGHPYTVPGYPTGINPVTGLPWALATDGLRNITGRVNRNGTATIWAVTSTVSGATDVGADPNNLLTHHRQHRRPIRPSLQRNLHHHPHRPRRTGPPRNLFHPEQHGPR